MDAQLENIWTQALGLLEKEIPRPSFAALRGTTHPMALYDDTVVIRVPNTFTRNLLEAKHSSVLKKTLNDLLQREVRLKFVIAPEPPPEEVVTAPELPFTRSEEVSRGLNPRYTFDSFVIGNSNRLAHAASQAVADMPAKAYNPLFIYGGVGLGKTHLMHAIGNQVIRSNPRLRVLYVSSETFTNEMINSIRDDKTGDFRNRYRNIDILLIDDIQFLSGKERTQEEFFHTFEALHGASKQIVISSDRPPKDILTLEERLRSRFEWGLIADIQPPDFETRIAILSKKAQLEDLKVSDEVITFIASRFETNIRELEGALIRVVAWNDLHQGELTPERAEGILKDVLPGARTRKVTIDLIKTQVSAYYGLSFEDMAAKKRTRAVAFPRQVAMYLCRTLTDISSTIIGEEFGGRDHSTVLHACEKIADDLNVDPQLKGVIKDLTERISTMSLSG